MEKKFNVHGEGYTIRVETHIGTRTEKLDNGSSYLSCIKPIHLVTFRTEKGGYMDHKWADDSQLQSVIQEMEDRIQQAIDNPYVAPHITTLKSLGFSDDTVTPDPPAPDTSTQPSI